jgi:hypothetical protein
MYNHASANGTHRAKSSSEGLGWLLPNNRISGFPTISVIIPAYKCAGTILKAVESVLDQTYAGPVEVIVVNDGSPDTKELESALVPFNDRLRYIKQQNRGVALLEMQAFLLRPGTGWHFLMATILGTRMPWKPCLGSPASGGIWCMEMVTMSVQVVHLAKSTGTGALPPVKSRRSR